MLRDREMKTPTRILTLSLGLLFLAGSASALTASPKVEGSLIDQLTCKPGENAVGTTGYAGLSGLRATRDLAIGDYLTREWPGLPQLFADSALLTSSGGVDVVRSADGQAVVMVALSDGLWRVEGSLACESLVRDQSVEAGQ